MKIAPFAPGGEAAWDAFVAAHPASQPFHRRAWADVLAASYGFEELSLVAWQDREPAGLLPLHLVRRPVGRPVLISAPLASVAGPLTLDAETADALLAEALRRARDRNVGYLEIRAGDGPGGAAASGDEAPWHVLDSYASFRKPLPERADDVLGAIPRKQRAEVRKARAAGVTVVAGRDVATFYRLYRRSVQRLGSPVFPRRYAEALVERFGADCEILTAEKDGVPLASVLTLYHAGWALPYHAGGSREAGAASAYPALYAALMERAVARGVPGFDFGRSIKGTGAYAFKRNFGFEAGPLPYRVALVADKAAPDLRPDNPRLKPIVEAWKRLPAPLADRLGPWVSRQIV